MTRIAILRRMIATLAATFVLLVPSSVLADTPIGSSGSIGARHLKDTMAKPGVFCRYSDGAGGGDQDLYLLRVKPPVIFAANTSADRDGPQLVGWRVLIQRRDAGSSQFVTVHKGGIHTAWAWDDTAATLHPREYSVTPLYGSDFRVRIKSFWYSGGGSVTGKATNEVDWYKKIYQGEWGSDIETLHHYCPDYYPG